MSQRTYPLDLLERQAEEQRTHLHESVRELRNTVRDRMDLNHLLQGRFVPAAIIAAILGISLGYSFAGIFSRK